MATFLYRAFGESILNKTIVSSLVGMSVKVALIDQADYNPTSATTHDFLDDLTGIAGAIVCTSAGTLTNKTTTGGLFDADDIDVVVPAGESANTIEALVLFHDTGNAATSPLIAYIDSGSGLPYTPPTGGGTVQIRWNPSGIFKVAG